MKKIILLITILFLLTGCYNYEELNKLAIVSAISINLEKNNQYNVIVQVVNPKKEQDTSSSNEPDFITFENTDKTLHEAFRKLTKKSLKKIYGNQMQIIIIDETIAQKNITDILDFLIREPEIRNEAYILIGKNKDILKILTPLNNISSKNIKESLENNVKRLGSTKIITLSDLTKDYKNPNIELTIPSIKILGNQNKGKEEQNLEKSQADTSIELDGIAVFKNNKLKGYLNNNESLTVNFITNKIKNTLFKLDYPNNKYIITEIINSKTKLTSNIKNKEITINIKGKAAITELNKNINIEKKENINKIQKELNNKLKKFLTKNYQNINNKYNSDIYGFKDLLYKENYKYYNKQINNKEDVLKSLKIKFKTNIEIIEQGNLIGGINNE